jgi:hypothetical protein
LAELVAGLVVAEVLLDVLLSEALLVLVEVFGLFSSGVALAAGVAGVDSLWLGADCKRASAAGSRTPKPQRAAAMSTHHFIEPDRTAFAFREDTLLPETLPLNLAVKI